MKRFILLFCMFLTGCTMFMTPPEIIVRDVTLVGADRDGVEMDLGLAVINHNSSSIKLTRYNYYLLVAELPMSKGEGREPFEFAADSTTDIKVPIRITYRDLLEILKRIPDPDHIPYQITANFDLKTGFGPVTIPAAKNGYFAVPQRYRPGQIFKELNELLQGNGQ